jgi:hypothetical protein
MGTSDGSCLGNGTSGASGSRKRAMRRRVAQSLVGGVLLSARLASIAYHDYEGIALRDDEKPRLVRDLGNANNLILRNHGLLTVGPTIADAFSFTYMLQSACEVQVLARSGGAELVHIGANVLAGTRSSIGSIRASDRSDRFHRELMPRACGPSSSVLTPNRSARCSACRLRASEITPLST